MSPSGGPACPLLPALALPAQGGRVSPPCWLAARRPLAGYQMPERCQQPRSPPGTRRFISPRLSAWAPLRSSSTWDYLCFPNEESCVRGQPEEEADDPLAPKCSGCGLQRVGRATPGVLSVQIDVAVLVCGRGEVRQYLVFMG